MIFGQKLSIEFERQPANQHLFHTYSYVKNASLQNHDILNKSDIPEFDGF